MEVNDPSFGNRFLYGRGELDMDRRNRDERGRPKVYFILTKNTLRWIANENGKLVPAGYVKEQEREVIMQQIKKAGAEENYEISELD